MEATKIRNCAAILAVAAALAPAVAGAAKVTQTIKIKNGWNAIYVYVAPDESCDEIFADWPVETVSAYDSYSRTRSGNEVEAANGETAPARRFTTWARAGQGLSTLQYLTGNSLLVFKATNAVTKTVAGTPMAQRNAWRVSDGESAPLNYIGVHLYDVASINLNLYLKGAADEIGNYKAYRIGGAGDEPEFRVMAGSMSSKPNSDEVIAVTSERVSDWSGPVFVSPEEGVIFGTNSVKRAFSVRNDSGATNTVKVAYIRAEDVAQCDAFYYRDENEPSVPFITTNEWKALTVDAEISRTLAPGETWNISCAVDSTRLGGTGAEIGGILRVREANANGEVMVPITVQDTRTAAGTYPAGLWIVEAMFTHVAPGTSHVEIDADESGTNAVERHVFAEPEKAGGVVSVRMFLSIDTNMNARLLPSVTVGKARLASVILPQDIDEIEMTAGGWDAGAMSFDYTVGQTSSANPFRHRYHPMFDGLKSDFKTPAPDGDNFDNYKGTVKPELFSVSNTVSFKLAEGAPKAWNASETLSGECFWTMWNVRAQGAIRAVGPFAMKRVSAKSEPAADK